MPEQFLDPPPLVGDAGNSAELAGDSVVGTVTCATDGALQGGGPEDPSGPLTGR